MVFIFNWIIFFFGCDILINLFYICEFNVDEFILLLIDVGFVDVVMCGLFYGLCLCDMDVCYGGFIIDV